MLGPPGQDVYIGSMHTHAGGATLRGVTVSCPNCRRPGRVPDGVYQFISLATRFAQQFDRDQATRLADALREFRDDDSNPDSVVAAAPAVARPFISEWLSKVDRKFWASILLTIVLFVCSERDTARSEQEISALAHRDQAIAAQIHEESDVNSELRRAIEELIRGGVKAVSVPPDSQPTESTASPPIRAPRQRAAPPATSLSPPAVMPNKNDPCWCGSKRKYHRCHRRSSDS